MSRAFLQHFERDIKGLTKHGETAVQAYLLEARSQPSQMYPQLVKALGRTSPKIEASLRTRGRSSFKDLWWSFTSTNSSLTDEIWFALAWFKDIVPHINKFRAFARNVERHILCGQFENALVEVRQHRNSMGWTVWGLEAEVAIIKEIGGSSEAKRYLAGLMEESSTRVASLLAAIFSDRCDDSLSIGTFIAKCDRSFPDIRLSSQIQDYLYYRSYGFLRNYDVAAPSILAVSSVNSFMDHYEALVDIFSAIVFDYSSPQYFPMVNEACKTLISLGVEDFRVNKILWISGGEYSISHEPDAAEEFGKRLSQAFFDCSNNPAKRNSEPFLQKLLDEVDFANRNMDPIQPEIDTLFAKGLQFRSFCFGVACAGFASSAARFSEKFISSPWGSFNSQSICIGDILSLELSLSLTVITEAPRCKASVEFNDRAKLLISVMKSPEDIALAKLSDIEVIWVARQLARLDEFERSRSVLECVEGRESIQAHKKTALKVLLLIGLGDLPKAAEVMAGALMNNSGYRRELPLALFFRTAKWADLKNNDIVAVGIVAHHANILLDDQDTRYIVRMACRSFYKIRPSADEIDAYYNNLDDDERIRLVEFLREVWVEDNLSMAGFQSTQEVRQDRIRVLQNLLQVDDGNSPNYREEIRDLTFELNLWKGLKHINETRIFVNEAAIARWAEKELALEFLRWQKLKKQDLSNTPLIDDMVLKYLVPDTIEGLFAQYPKIGLTEADAALINLIERLLARFFYDPTDGLNCYLSSRIRHGTLKGTLLGPLEEAGFIGQTNEALRAELSIKTIAPELVGDVISSLRDFEKDLATIVERLIKKDVQIRGVSAPTGRIYAYLSPENGLTPIVTLADNLNFSVFVPACFELFWTVLGYSLDQLRQYVKNEVKSEIQSKFDKLIERFSGKGESLVGLISTLRAVATSTQAQCDLVADWFSPNRSLQQQQFSLREAIEIARKTTKNVYRGFPDEILIVENFSLDTPLTPMGLSAITDCLYVLFENAWKHSGLSVDLDTVNVEVETNSDLSFLKLTVSHSLSSARLNQLREGELRKIIDTYIVNADIRMAASEGGSGLAKIVRYTRGIDRSLYPEPVAISLDEADRVAVTVHLPIFQRDGAYDAYFE